MRRVGKALGEGMKGWSVLGEGLAVCGVKGRKGEGVKG